MAEEGTPSEGQESNENAVHLSSMHSSTYEEMKAENLAESQQGAMGWAQAVSKDERAQSRQRSSEPKPSRSRESLRTQYRARQDWQRTVRGVRWQMRTQLHPSSPTEPYAKGEGQSFLDRIAKSLEKAWRLFTG